MKDNPLTLQSLNMSRSQRITQRWSPRVARLLLAGFLLLVADESLWAQSDTQPSYGGGAAAPSRPAGSFGSSSAPASAPRPGLPVDIAAPAANMQPALRGFCPVALAEMKEWVRGDPQYQFVHDGKLYVFSGAQSMQMFRAAPDKYAPALGGDCVVQFATNGERVPGDLSLGARHRGRVFFFANAQNKQAFMANPGKYSQADLVLGGECVVCRKDMSQAMPGMPELTVLHNGLRYQFAGTQQRQKFLADPAGYASFAREIAAAGGTPGSGTQEGGTTVPPADNGTP